MTTPGPSVSGQPTPTTVDLDAIRLRLDQLSQPVPQGAGALWQTRHDRDHAIGTARDLLAELGRARSQLAEAREALCQPGAIRCEAGKQAILSVSGTGHDSIAKVVAERDELLAALNRFRDGMDDADFDYAMTPERHAERIRGMSDTYRASSWWSFAEATHAQLMRVLAERDEARAALATAERQREEARVKHLSLADGTDVFIDGDVYTVVDVDFTSPGALVTLAALGSTPDTPEADRADSAR